MNLCGVAKAAVCSAAVPVAKEHQTVSVRKGRHMHYAPKGMVSRDEYFVEGP